MAVVVNSNASFFYRQSNLPSALSMSMGGWFYFGVDRGVYQGFLAAANTSDGNPGVFNQLSTDTLTNSLQLKLWPSTSPGGTILLNPLVPGTWYFMAMTCAGTGAGQLAGYIRTLGQNSLTSVTETSNTFTPAQIEWGRDGFDGDYMDGRAHAMWMADTVLSANEILALSYFHEPQLFGIRSLNCFYPTIESVNTNAMVDRSGNGRNAGVGSIGALADAPPLLWVPKRARRPVFVSAGGSGIATTASDTNTPTDSAVSVTQRLSVAVDTNTPTDSSVALTTRVANATDTNTPTDSGVSISSRLSVAIDTNTPTDSAEAVTGFPVEASDTNTPSDAAVALTNRVAVAVDTSTPTDEAVSTSERLSIASDTITFSDSAELASDLSGVGVDTVILTDSAVSVTQRLAVAVDTVIPTDTAVSITTRLSVATDTVSFSDSSISEVTTDTVVTGSDSVSFTDSSVSTSERVSQAEDTLVPTDEAVSISSRLSVAEDGVNFSDQAESFTELLAIGTDTIVLSDSAFVGEPPITAFPIDIYLVGTYSASRSLTGSYAMARQLIASRQHGE